MKIKQKKCKYSKCGRMYTPFMSTQQVCSHGCAIGYAKEKREAQEKREWNKQKKQMEEDLRTHPQWMKILQTTFNTFIRTRDYHDPCITCGKTQAKWDAGHFFSAGNYPSVRIDEDNVHKQCSQCNQHEGGNLHKYRPALIRKIGKERFDELDRKAHQTELKLSIPEIQDLIVHYKEKTKELKKSLSLS